MATATFSGGVRHRGCHREIGRRWRAINCSSHSRNRKPPLSPHRCRQAAFSSHAWPWGLGYSSGLPWPPNLADGLLERHSVVPFQQAIDETLGRREYRGRLAANHSQNTTRFFSGPTASAAGPLSAPQAFSWPRRHRMVVGLHSKCTAYHTTASTQALYILAVAPVSVSCPQEAAHDGHTAQ